MLLSLALLASALSLVSAGGTTEVSCNVTSVTAWANNAEGISPCQVAANLGAVCSTTGSYDISALVPAFDSYYTPSNLATPCECSSVTYSLAAACGLCQGGTFTSWLIWSQNCTHISPGTFPFTIPAGTNVPHWAYSDVQSTNRFDPVQAQSVGVLPESTATGPTTTASSTAGSSSTPLAASPTHSSGSSKKKSTPVGAIVGGVVGGIVGLAAIALVVFFIVKRQKSRRQAAPAAYNTSNNNGSSEKPSYIVDPAPVSPHVPYSPPPGQDAYPRPYDPNDPSTFPGAQTEYRGSMTTSSPPPDGSFNNRNSMQPGHFEPSGYSASIPSHQHQHPTGYSGVAEV